MQDSSSPSGSNPPASGSKLFNLTGTTPEPEIPVGSVVEPPAAQPFGPAAPGAIGALPNTAISSVPTPEDFAANDPLNAPDLPNFATAGNAAGTMAGNQAVAGNINGPVPINPSAQPNFAQPGTILSNPGTMPSNTPGIPPVAGAPIATSAPRLTKAHNDHNRRVIETVILIIVSLIAVTFIGLFIWKYLEWNSIRIDIDGQIDSAVAAAVYENTTKLENEFVEREKYPYKTFVGPVDYGSLSFEYPKTWNVYIARDTSSGGNFEAYLNPGEVQPVSTTTINALRVIIYDQSFDNINRTYDSLLRNGKLSIATRSIGSAVANVYTGTLPNNIQGIATLFKLRDKTVLIQTDALLFSDEYYKLLDTVTFVE